MEILLTHLKKAASLLLTIAFLAELAGGLLLFPRTAEAAITVDASTPVRFSGAPAEGVPITSASFTAPANSVLIACVHGDDNSVPLTFTVADTGSLQWTLRASRGLADAGAVDGHASVYTAVTTSAVARTVSVTRVEDSLGTDEISAKVYVVTGASTASPVATVGEGSSGSNSITPTLFNASPNGSYAFVCGTDWNSNGVPVSSDLTVDGSDQTGISSLAGYKQLTTSGAQTGNLDAAGAAAASWNWVALAITPRSNLAKPPNNLGLVGYWPLNEATSTQAGDFSGNGNAGTLASGPSWGAGARAEALRFDGGDDVVSAPHSTSLNITGSAVTLSAWVKVEDTADTVQTLVGKLQNDGTHTDPYFAYQLALDEVSATTHAIRFGVTTGGTYTGMVSSAFPNGVWTHVAGVYNGTTMETYINGVNAGGIGKTGSINSYTSSLRFGENGLSEEELLGMLDEVRVYNRALNPSEIAALAGVGGGSVRTFASSKTLTNGTTLGPANGLVGLWSFDGGDINWTSASAGVAYDGSGNNNTGTLTSMTRAGNPVLGKLGQALSFNGTSNYVSLGTSATLSPTAKTITAWINPAAFSPTEGTIVHSGATWSFYDCSAATTYCPAISSTLGYLHDGSGGTGVWRSPANAITLNQWQHVAVTFDCSSDANNPVLYVDGVSVTVTELTAPSSMFCGDTATKLIGFETAFNTKYFNGKIDDVRIYNRILTTAEITQLYRLGAVKIVP